VADREFAEAGLNEAMERLRDRLQERPEDGDPLISLAESLEWLWRIRCSTSWINRWRDRGRTRLGSRSVRPCPHRRWSSRSGPRNDLGYGNAWRSSARLDGRSAPRPRVSMDRS